MVYPMRQEYPLEPWFYSCSPRLTSNNLYWSATVLLVTYSKYQDNHFAASSLSFCSESKVQHLHLCSMIPLVLMRTRILTKRISYLCRVFSCRLHCSPLVDWQNFRRNEVKQQMLVVLCCKKIFQPNAEYSFIGSNLVCVLAKKSNQIKLGWI